MKKILVVGGTNNGVLVDITDRRIQPLEISGQTDGYLTLPDLSGIGSFERYRVIQLRMPALVGGDHVLLFATTDNSPADLLWRMRAYYATMSRRLVDLDWMPPDQKPLIGSDGTWKNMIGLDFAGGQWEDRFHEIQ
jgi:hypothetical protein